RGAKEALAESQQELEMLEGRIKRTLHHNPEFHVSMLTLAAIKLGGLEASLKSGSAADPWATCGRAGTATQTRGNKDFARRRTMRRLILIFIVFLPIMLIAQQTGLTQMKEQPGPGASPLGDAFSTGGSPDASVTSNASGTSPSGSESQPDPLPQQTSQSTQTQKTAPAKEPSGPPLEGSMVGYVDDAIIGSQIRIRFDAAFKDNAPDRAEFFYPQCGCNGGGAPGPQPGASNNINFQQLYFQGEYAPVSRFSIFTEIPIRWIQPQSFIPGTFPNTVAPFSNQSGISDVRAGFKLAVTAASDHSLTFQFKAYFPSGDGSRGLGTDHYSVEPSLLYYQRLSERWAVESQVGGWIPINGSSLSGVGNYAGDIFFYGIGPSYQLVNRDNIKFAPVVELFGWRVLGGLETVATPAGAPTVDDASGTNIVTPKVGARTSFGRHNSVYVGFGQAVTHSVWYEHIVRAEYRYSF